MNGRPEKPLTHCIDEGLLEKAQPEGWLHRKLELLALPLSNSSMTNHKLAIGFVLVVAVDIYHRTSIILCE